MKKAARKAVKKSSTAKEKDVAASFNRFKIFQGHQYTGTTVGRAQKWNYDPGIWTDKKITPDKWLISFEVTKRRRGHAPEGSGVPVGTEYHWYILAHQMVKKLDANTYSTAMNGLKFKLSHKRADKDKWNISDETQRKHLVRILQDFIDELQAETVDEFVKQEQSQVKTKKQLAEEAKKKASAKKMSASTKKVIKAQPVTEEA